MEKRRGLYRIDCKRYSDKVFFTVQISAMSSVHVIVQSYCNAVDFHKSIQSIVL